MQLAKETVIVVHGTFSAKNDEGPPNWYAPNQAFCNQLDQELKNRNSNAQCWAHLKSGEDFFHWDGRNDWRSRAKATTRLRNEIKRLKSKGYVVHLVGHRHGGNVVIDSTTDDGGETQSWLNGRVVLFGTPIYRDNWDYRKRRKLRLGMWTALSLFAWSALALYSTRGFSPLAAFADNAATQNVALFVAAALLLASVFLGLSAVGVFKLHKNPMKYRWSPAFLSINTPFDEAYRSLAGLPGSDNPLLTDKESPSRTDTTPSSFSAFAQVLESVRGSLAGKIRKTFNIGTITSTVIIALFLFLAGMAWRPIATSVKPGPLSDPELSIAFLLTIMLLLLIACIFRRNLGHAVLLPGILIANTLPLFFKTVIGLLMVLFDTVAKNAAWGLLKSFSLGISGAPRKAEDIDVSLRPGGDNLYLELPLKFVEEVQTQQKPHLDKIHELLYEASIKWTPGELREQLEGTNFPMIHTTYYRNAECIQKAADWIAEPVHEYWDGQHKLKTTTTNQGTGFIEEIDGPNGYRNHLGRLKLRISDPGSVWRKPLSSLEVISVATQCGLPSASWDEHQHIVFEPGKHMPARVPHPPPREK